MDGLATLHRPLPVVALASALSEARWEAAGVSIGVGLLVVGLAAIVLFFFRHKSRDQLLLSFSAFIILYAVRLIALQPDVLEIFGLSKETAHVLNRVITYIIVIPFTLFLMRVVGKRSELIFQWVLATQIVFAVIAIPLDTLHIATHLMETANSILVLLWLVTGVFMTLVLRAKAEASGAAPTEIRVFLVGLFVWMITAAHANLGALHLVPGRDVEPLGFIVFVGCLGYIAASRVFANEERLTSIQKEMEIARQIQTSILPRELPKMAGLEIAARYLPMSAVAGDFYDFLPVDESRLGIFIADVSGHGVPAALIGSMLKVALASQSLHASDPARVLSELNAALSGKFEGHYVTAAYLFLDLEANRGRYAAAGHPPMLVALRDGASSGSVREVEENGLPLGLVPETEYRSVEFPLAANDRFFLYTDGVPEAENAAEQEFGRAGCRQFLAKHAAEPVEQFADSLLAELRAWSPSSATSGHNDDITFVLLQLRKP